MSGPQLGQRVRFTDRLVRVSVHVDRNAPRQEELLKEALELMGVSRQRGSTTHTGLSWKLWVPQSFAHRYLHRGLSMLRYSSAPTAGEGFITQLATLQQGGSYYPYDDAAVWMDHGTTRAYKVAFDINRMPVHVLPEHVEPLP